jgi:hypothetical protein
MIKYIKQLIKRITICFNYENRIQGNYKIFSFIPNIGFILDIQCKDDYVKNHKVYMKGCIVYSLYFEWLIFYLNIELHLENK